MSVSQEDRTRVFVSGLPRSLTSDQLATHFRGKFAVTDAHVFPDRRIGFVGFHDHTTAQNAVKFFDRSYIRLSKITVDLARPIEVKSDTNGQAVPVSQRNRGSRRGGDEGRYTHSDSASRYQTDSGASRKRKRKVEDDGEDARPQELEQGHAQQPLPSPPISASGSILADEDHISHVTNEAEKDDQEIQPASDMDWLRGKTSRVLDLIGPDEAMKTNSQNLPNGAPDLPDPAEVALADEPDSAPEADAEEPAKPKIQKVPNGRLFIRNLAFDVTEADLRSVFGSFGKIQEMHIVLDNRKSTSKGMAYIQYSDNDEAEKALQSMDGVAFHGRLLHILPAADKRDKGLTDFDISKMPLKKQKAVRRKMEAASATFSWNSLYMNPDAVLASIASRLGVSKSDILDPTSADAAVTQAHAETQIITETKDYLRSRGVNIDAFKNRNRDDRTILLKNFSYGTSEVELRGLLEQYGDISQYIMPPAGTMALVQFAEPHVASQALKGLSYKNVRGSMLYVEKAPRDLLTQIHPGLTQVAQIAQATDIHDQKLESPQSGPSATVFVRNLNFTTSTARLTEIFSPLAGFISARVKTRTEPKRPGQVLSMGFGFAEFSSNSHADAAVSAMNGYRLDGHELLVKPSTKTSDLAEERRQADTDNKKSANKTKIVIKNLPFQATKKDIRSLFAQYGQLKSVRLPKKFDNTSRGFAFAEFITAKEASNAVEALGSTHLLGRRLVLDFVEEENVDAEDQIKAIEKKVEQQSQRINLSKLMGTGRKKFNVGDAEGDFA